MLYKKNLSPVLDTDLFTSPTSEYRGAPFWAWNCKLEKDELLRQIDVLHEMGFGGFHMHVRSGMDTEYLGREFMERVRDCAEKAQNDSMLAWLYDEDRWPSGFAGGIVTKDKEYRIRYLLMTPTPYSVEGGKTRVGNEQMTALRSGNGRLIGVFDIELSGDGKLASYRMINEGDEPRGRIWYAYIESPQPSARYNGYTYVDTMSKPAIDRFINVTHEAYRKALGDMFGATVPAIFTDEPQFTHKQTLAFPDRPKDITLPWTDDIDDSFRAAYGVGLTEHIPELIWELPDGVSRIRYLYHDHACERFATGFADNIGHWCDSNGIALTGHMMKEPTLATQTSAVGEAMRSLRAFAIPGVDMLANRYELTTVKQAASVAHQYRREGVLSELYGVTGWDFDFRGHKLQGDWQAALGVTVRVPHLSWVSMAGESKRDYPASINYQSPWYKKYSYVEDHFARLNTALTRGTPSVRIAVIHPVESFWLHWGPSSQTALDRSRLDARFSDVTNWLLYGSLDFDYICESLLSSLCEKGGFPLTVGAMKYEAVIIPGCETLRKSTILRLSEFRRAGGKLIFMGDAPMYMDALPSDEPAHLMDKSEHISFDRSSLLYALESVRTIDIRGNNGELTENLFHQLRFDGARRWLFISQGKQPYNKDISRRQDIQITIAGIWRPTLYDTINGDTAPVPFSHRDGKTVIPASLWLHDSLLFALDPCDDIESLIPVPAEKPIIIDKLPLLERRVKYETDEPNALLLDIAEYALDDEEYTGPEEILRADTILRRRLGWEPWGGSANQPWCIPSEPVIHSVRLRFTVNSGIPLDGVSLALEAAGDASICLNGETVPSVVTGYYVDRAIQTVALPHIPAGRSLLELIFPFGKRTATEWCYLLGDFGVRVDGSTATVTERPCDIAFGSITTQGFPFYSGKFTYTLRTDSSGGDLEIRLPQYRAAVYDISLDDGKAVTGAYAPYNVRFKSPSAGIHTVNVTLYLSRANGFSHLHCADENISYASPSAWRTSGDAFCYEYRLNSEGLLVSPAIREIF